MIQHFVGYLVAYSTGLITGIVLAIITPYLLRRITPTQVAQTKHFPKPTKPTNPQKSVIILDEKHDSELEDE